ncbi:MAG: 50S ribosomal protein L4 [Chloroflexi bacterium]|nr:50S ribosomal protein L4 [Chloroflexota bacterium]
MAEVNVYNMTGAVVGQRRVAEAVFGVPLNTAVVHQAYVRQLANARQGTHSTKTRGEVAGSTRKLFRQKGTGRARQGSIRAPHRRGGGIVFGPKPRDYRQDMPKKMRRLALRAMLSDKLRAGELFVLESLSLPEPKTKQMLGVLSALGLTASTLLVTAGVDRTVILSARNIPWVRTLPANQLNIRDLVNYRNVVMTAAALEAVERLWGGGAEEQEPQEAAAAEERSEG